MKSPTTSAAVCFDHFKTAALYFDRVIPADVTTLASAIYPQHLRELEQQEGLSNRYISEAAKSIKGPNFRSALEIVFGIDAGHDEYMRWHDASEQFAREVFHSSPKDAEARKKYAISAYAGKEAMTAYLQFLRTFNLRAASLFLPDQTSFDRDEQCSDVLALICGLDLIDGEAAELEQIVEIRRDDDARNKLRRLRTFLLEKYKDKSPQFIEDDFFLRIEDYKTVAKKHGFELVTSSLGAVIEAKSIQAALGAGLAGALVGGPITGITASVSLELATLALTIAKGVFQYRGVLQTHEAAYVVHAEQCLSR